MLATLAHEMSAGHLRSKRCASAADRRSAKRRSSPAPRRKTNRAMSDMVEPLIPGFNPDPSIVAVDGVYYLVTSTFEYLPDP